MQTGKPRRIPDSARNLNPAGPIGSMHAMSDQQNAPGWQRLSECPRVILYPPNLYRTVATALVVGTILFAINHLDTVLAGQANLETWTKTGLTYLVPFCVSNIGLLVGTRQKAGAE